MIVDVLRKETDQRQKGPSGKIVEIKLALAMNGTEFDCYEPIKMFTSKVDNFGSICVKTGILFCGIGTQHHGLDRLGSPCSV